MRHSGIRILRDILPFVLITAIFFAGCTAPAGTGAHSAAPVAAAPGTMVPGTIPSDNGTITIGAIYNLEGSEATFDVPSAQGAELAIKELNEQGGIGGRSVRLVVENGKSDTATVVSAAEKLAGSGTIPVIIGLSNPNHALPAAQAAAAHQVYFITSGATSPRLPQQVPRYLWLACMGDNTQAAVGAEYAAGTLGAKNVYVIYESDKEYPTLLAGYFVSRFSGLNGSVQKVDTFRSTDTGFASQVANLSCLSPRPDMVYVSAETWAEARPVIQAVRNAGFTVPVMGGDGYDAPVLLTMGAAGIDNVYYTTHTWINPNTAIPQRKKFMERYEREYNRTPVAFAGLGYDAVMIVAQAMNNSASPTAFAEGMERITLYRGVTGNLTYQDDTHIPKKSVALMEIRNGTPYYIGNFVPAVVPAP
jgi:branched-chain amino acid transport system substrate-binding protein